MLCFFKIEILKGKVFLVVVISDCLVIVGDVFIMVVYWLLFVLKFKVFLILDWIFWNKLFELFGYIGIKKLFRCFID